MMNAMRWLSAIGPRRWTQCFPVTQKTAEQTLDRIYAIFRAIGTAVQMVYTDNSPELDQGCAGLWGCTWCRGSAPTSNQRRWLKERCPGRGRRRSHAVGTGRHGSTLLAVCLSAFLLCIQCHRSGTATVAWNARHGKGAICWTTTSIWLLCGLPANGGEHEPQVRQQNASWPL